MVRLKAGDRVECRVKAGNIVNAYDDYDIIYTFEIVTPDDEGYYLYIPHHIYLQGGSTLDATRCRRLGIELRFAGEKISYISEGQVFRVVSQMDGRKCDRCEDFFAMARSNQPDDGFLCYSCRFNPYR